MKPNVILFSDHTEVLYMQKTLGVFKIANELRNAGFTVQVISHLHTFSVNEVKELLSDLVSDETLFIGFSPFFYKLTDDPEILSSGADHQLGGLNYRRKQLGSMLPHGIKYNQEIKQHVSRLNSNCKFVLGGPDAIDSGHITDYDYVVIGYADNSIINLAKHLSSNETLINSRKSLHGPIIIDDRVADGYDFTSIPTLYSVNDLILPGETISIEVSRGCIFRCKFCAYPLNGKKKTDYIKLEDILYREFLDNYQKYGVTRYTFADDTFNDSQEKVHMLHRISQRLPFDLEYWAYIRLDLLSRYPETISLLYESGCRAFYFGIETMHAESAKSIGKGGDRKKHIETLQQLKKMYGNKVMLHGSFIFGLPKEDVDSMKYTGTQLSTGEIPLDSWFISPLYFSPHRNFVSELDKNFSNYGYSLQALKHGGYDWKNQYTNFRECNDIANHFMMEGDISGQKKISGAQSFYIAGLGFDLDYSCNKSIADFDWHSVTLKKQQRQLEYKSALKNLLSS